MLDYGKRFYDPQIGRFTALDPLTEHFPWMTSYQYASNNPIKYIDLDGMEGLVLGIGELLGIDDIPFSEALSRAVGEIAGKAVETGTKTPKFSPEQLENFSRGNQAEAEQLAKEGIPKNTTPIKEIDPKTGEKGISIPDGFKNGGKQTVEIKNVKQQGYTKQLRIQEKFSNDNGFKPELIINEGAKLSKPLQKSSFDIKTYEIETPIINPQDNTKAPTYEPVINSTEDKKEKPKFVIPIDPRT
jgi:hypothetical protein